MSFDAIRWALAQPVEKSSSKFVLVAMADCVNNDADMVCWPSAAHLSRVTALDQKTVVEALKRLRATGFITATGEKRGPTRQVVAYRLTTPGGTEAATAPETYTYLYQLTDPKTGEFYIDVRTSKVPPSADFSYRGRGPWCQMKRLAGAPLTRVILGEFGTAEEAAQAHRLAIQEAFMDAKCMNKEGLKTPETGLVRGDELRPEPHPNLEGNSPEIPVELTQISLVPHPKTGDGTSKQPGKNKEGTKKTGFDASNFPLPEWIDRGDWIRWCDDRRTRKKPITEHAAPLQLKALGEYRHQGFSPRQVIDHSIANSYQGLFPPKAARPALSGRHTGFQDKDYAEGVTDGVPDA